MSTLLKVPLRRLVDAGQWEAEDLAGRLGIVAHAAFLRAGFVPYGDEPRSSLLLKQVDEVGPSAPSLSRRYTAAQLARREGPEVAVLELRAQGNGDVAFQAYLLTRDGGRACSCQAPLDEATLAPLLSGRLADAARALETGSADAWLWKSLADWVLPALLLELCRRNDLPVTGFASLPDDAKAEILKRLADGKELARVECTSRQLRRLVADRDGELWKAMYESLDLLPEAQSSDGAIASWKERYVKAWKQLPPQSLWPLLPLPVPFDPYDEDEWILDQLAQDRHQRSEREFSFRFRQEDYPIIEAYLLVRAPPPSAPEPPHLVRYPPPPALEPAPAASEVVAREKNAGRQHRKVPRNEYKKQRRHGAGAIHSPSSRHRWTHR